MKIKIFKTFTFYFMILSLIMIFMHYRGQDSHGIALFHLNIILKSILHNSLVLSFVKLGPKISCGSVAGEIYVFWYVLHFISFVIYGLTFDIIKLTFKKVLRVSA